MVAFYSKTDGNWRKVMRFNNGTPEDGAGNALLTAGNYNSYSPTLTGGGASGNWSINSAGITGYTLEADTANASSI